MWTCHPESGTGPWDDESEAQRQEARGQARQLLQPSQRDCKAPPSGFVQPDMTQRIFREKNKTKQNNNNNNKRKTERRPGMNEFLNRN